MSVFSKTWLRDDCRLLQIKILTYQEKKMIWYQNMWFKLLYTLKEIWIFQGSPKFIKILCLDSVFCGNEDNIYEWHIFLFVFSNEIKGSSLFSSILLTDMNLLKISMKIEFVKEFKQNFLLTLFLSLTLSSL